MITAYYLCHGQWTVIPHQLEDNFRDIVDCGFTAVAISFSESEMVYSRRAFEIQVNLAKKHGLKVLVIPSRIGGRFAGAPLMPSMWLTQNPDCMMHSQYQWPMAVIESERFQQWVKEFMTTVVTDYDLDGLIWDEPKGMYEVSKHPDTLAKCGENPTSEQMMDSFVDWLSSLTDHCRSIAGSDFSITMFCQAADSPEYFTSRAAKMAGLDYFGYDGNLAPTSSFGQKPEWRKYRIDSVWDRTVKECAAEGKKTFALIENMLMPASSIPIYEENMDNFLKNCRPDHLGIYYYAHENEDPETTHKVTRGLMKKHL